MCFSAGYCLKAVNVPAANDGEAAFSTVTGESSCPPQLFQAAVPLLTCWWQQWQPMGEGGGGDVTRGSHTKLMVARNQELVS